MTQTITPQTITAGLIAKLKDTGWDTLLNEFLVSKEFETIVKFFINESTQGRRFTPPMKNWFRFLTECPYNQLKVIIIGQDPYKNEGIADGMAFSCKDNTEPQPSLKYFLAELIEATGSINTMSTDLTPLANQGVLLLNVALTTELGIAGKHFDIWKPFIEFLLRSLNAKDPGMIYLFLGKKAAEFEHLIEGSKNHKFFATHPAYAAYQKTSKWDSNGAFKSINQTLTEHFNTKIIW